MAKKRRSGDTQGDLFDITPKLRTAVCVDSLRESIRAWRSRDYVGVTLTTRALLTHWFGRDHRLKDGSSFAYHRAQREAIETLIFVWECQRIRSRADLLLRFSNELPPLWERDDFPRFCTKMATGSGKTKVMGLAIAWQFLNSQCEEASIAAEYASTFVLLAPNVIVHERLQSDFAKGRIFEWDPIIPREMRAHWDFSYVSPGEGDAHKTSGTLFLSNVQQLYQRSPKRPREPGPISGVLGSPGLNERTALGFGDRIRRRSGRLLVLNDEAHHTHSETSAWTEAIHNLAAPTSISLQIDFSATPRFPNGSLFPWIISDYPLKQAIVDGLVKRPMRGEASFTEVSSERASLRYEGFLVAGVERWKEYVSQLAPTGKKPVLFVMLSNTAEADEVADWLRRKYPGELAGDQTLVIHTDREGEVSKGDLDKARALARSIDSEENSVRAIVSVLMLREGWDVQNVTVVVGLRPFTAAANILPEQAIGRGLRLMFRGQERSTYEERVDIIGNEKFLEFVDSLEDLEEVRFERFDLKSSPLRITTVTPLAERLELDIGVPQLSPALVRRKSIAQELAELDVKRLPHTPLQLPAGSVPRVIKYEGYDVVTDEKELERIYSMPTMRTSQELVGYYARRIAETLRLPGQFAAIAAKVKEFLSITFFNKVVDVEDEAVLNALSRPLAHQLTMKAFREGLANLVVEEIVPVERAAARSLLTCRPFPWSQHAIPLEKTVFNLTPCDGGTEERFARFLDAASDVVSFARLVPSFGFGIEYTDGLGGFRLFYPRWVVKTQDGTNYLLALAGTFDEQTVFRDRAALLWCINASRLTRHEWRFERISGTSFTNQLPSSLSNLLNQQEPLQLRLLDGSIEARALSRSLYSKTVDLADVVERACSIFTKANIPEAARWLNLELSGYGDNGTLHELLGVSADNRLAQHVASYRVHAGERSDGGGVAMHFFVESLKELADAGESAARLGQHVSKLTLTFADSSPAALFSADVFDRILLGLRATLKQQLERVAR